MMAENLYVNLKPLLTILTSTSSACYVWFDSASKKRKQDLDSTQIIQRLTKFAVAANVPGDKWPRIDAPRDRQEIDGNRSTITR